MELSNGILYTYAKLFDHLNYQTKIKNKLVTAIQTFKPNLEEFQQKSSQSKKKKLTTDVLTGTPPILLVLQDVFSLHSVSTTPSKTDKGDTAILTDKIESDRYTVKKNDT